MAAPTPGGLINGSIVPTNNVADLSGNVSVGNNLVDMSGNVTADNVANVSGNAATTTPGVQSQLPQAEPTLRTVNPGTETVSGQLDTLLQKDNPLMQTARSHAAEAANSRGLLNSSMAVQSGEQAAIESALPIATADANAYGTAARENQGFQNQFGLQRQSGEIQSGLSAQTAGQAAQLSAQQSIQDLTLQGLRGDQAKVLADTEAQWHEFMQTSASSAQFFTQSMQAISAILANTDISVDQRQAAIDHQMELLNAGLAVIGGVGNVDLTGLLNFNQVNPVAPGAQASGPAAPPVESPPGVAPRRRPVLP